jgi:hypothetical protein
MIHANHRIIHVTQLDALKARIAELEAALSPFAGPVAPGLHDEQYITGEFHVRDFRRAAAAIRARPAP